MLVLQQIQNWVEELFPQKIGQKVVVQVLVIVIIISNLKKVSDQQNGEFEHL
jgi:hypothetical protein